MDTMQAPFPSARKPIRLWPGVAIVAIQWILRFIVPAVYADGILIGLLGAMAGGLLILLWWLFFSRAPWLDRLVGLAAIIGSFGLIKPLLDISMATGAQGMLFIVLAVPFVSMAFVLAVAATRKLAGGKRRAILAASVLASLVPWTFVKTGGLSSNFDNDLSWRWAKTKEQQLLARAPDEPASAPAPAPLEPEVKASTEKPVEAAPVAPVPPPGRVLWPGFRGPDRDGVVRGTHIQTDWMATPPVELWRRPVGPGWSSFAVAGNLIYTQEQRGEEEVVAAYRADTGKPVWMHKDKARFWESNAGAGPRGTPSVVNGRIYTLGATGIANALDARTGAVVWSRDAAADTGAKLPDWGFSGSPLLTADAVVIAASGRLVAYDIATGKPRWLGPSAGSSYSSPELATIDGVPQILLLSSVGITSVNPSDGTQLWQHQWKGYPIVQPALTPDGGILVSVTESSGTRRLAAARAQGEWTVEERWTSNGLKPYFNDFVIHKGHAFGFDGAILACIDLADGKRKWKGGRYGQGQLVLLPDQDLLLVLSEEGELALVKATSDGFTEVARRPAIEGKTWNHPVLAGDVLFVRNGEEMAAFRIPQAVPGS